MNSKTIGRNTSSNGHKIVEYLPRVVEKNASYWIESPNGKHEYTHSLFKFPAKFHPPIVKWALDTYYKNGKVFDPFMGSGTVQVESLAKGISSIGIDIDPIAVFISKVKSCPLNPKSLKKDYDVLKTKLLRVQISHQEQENISGGDISYSTYEKEARSLRIPPIPNIEHWFRWYVIIDLARLLQVIESLNIDAKSQDFFKACFASILRRVSNAEPSTVSGIEVTRIQAELNKTRKISVFKTFFKKVDFEIINMTELLDAYKESGSKASVKIFSGDVVNFLQKKKKALEDVSLVITSPPYCRAVEYSRRHILEMYWLGFVDNQIDHIALTHSYIGRKLVRLPDWNEKIVFGIPSLDKTITKVENADIHKGRTVRHYFYSIDNFFDKLSKAIPSKTTIVCVVGNSICCNIPINTSGFISNLAGQYLDIKKEFSYAIRNHHMKYGLWNGDGIKQEHVLIMKSK
ncbi:MAG: DNA methyltransferase [Chloroflexota bacterium]